MTIPGYDLAGWAQSVRFGPGAVHDVGEVLAGFGRSRPLVVCSWRRQRSDGFRHLAGGLGVTPRAFTGVEPHVPRLSVDAAWEAVRDGGADAVVSFGGGAAVDLGKALVYLAQYGAEAFDEGRFAEPVEEPVLVHVAVPTTHAGAEATHRVKVSVGPEKREWAGPTLRPSAVVLDPSLALGLPPRHAAATAFTALAHCAEGLYADSGWEETGRLAEESASAVVRAVPVVDRAPEDLRARSDLLAASYVAGVVHDQAGGCLHHGLCTGLGARTGIAHGVVSAILLGPVLRFNADTTGTAQGRFAEAVGASDPAEAAGTLERLVRDLRLPRRLREAGVFEQDLDPVADWAVGRSEEVRRNPKPVSREDVLEVLRSAW